MDTATLILTIGIFGAIALGGIAIRKVIIPRIERIAKKTNSSTDDLILSALYTIKIRSYVILGILTSLSVGAPMPEVLEKIVGTALLLFIGFEITRILFHVTDFLIQEYTKKFGIAQEAITTIIPTLGVLIKVAITVVTSVLILSNLGVDVIPLITGLGVAGMAAAFALKNIIADLFSAFVIFLDKPFAVNNFIKVKGVSGTVERVGIKTTHLRAGTGEKIIIPNRDLVDVQVINNADLSERKVVLHIPIAYDTDNKKITGVLDNIKDIILSHKNTKVKTIAIAEFSRHAIILEAIYQITGVSYAEHIETRHYIHLAVLDIIREQGIKLGYNREAYR